MQLKWQLVTQESLDKLYEPNRPRSFLYVTKPFEVGDEVGYVTIYTFSNVQSHNTPQTTLMAKPLLRSNYKKFLNDYIQPGSNDYWVHKDDYDLYNRLGLSERSSEDNTLSFGD